MIKVDLPSAPLARRSTKGPLDMDEYSSLSSEMQEANINVPVP